jgi:hypothetical protein
MGSVTERRFVREADRLDGAPPAAGPLDVSPLLGIWTNTNPASRGIVRFVLGCRDGILTVRSFGAGSPERDWGEVEAERVYTDGIASRNVMSFTARYDFGFLECHLQANMNLGLLVVAGFNTFKDGSGRSSYFSREFYHR